MNDATPIAASPYHRRLPSSDSQRSTLLIVPTPMIPVIIVGSDDSPNYLKILGEAAHPTILQSGWPFVPFAHILVSQTWRASETACGSVR